MRAEEKEKLLAEWVLALDRIYAALDAVTIASRTQIGLDEAAAELSSGFAELDRLADVMDRSEVIPN